MGIKLTRSKHNLRIIKSELAHLHFRGELTKGGGGGGQKGQGGTGHGAKHLLCQLDLGQNVMNSVWRWDELCD